MPFAALTSLFGSFEYVAVTAVPFFLFWFSGLIAAIMSPLDPGSDALNTNVRPSVATSHLVNDQSCGPVPARPLSCPLHRACQLRAPRGRSPSRSAVRLRIPHLDRAAQSRSEGTASFPGGWRRRNTVPVI